MEIKPPFEPKNIGSCNPNKTTQKNVGLKGEYSTKSLTQMKNFANSSKNEF